MGIDVIVIVENSKNLTLEEFKTLLLQDKEAGPLLWESFGDPDKEFQPWEAFEWEGKKYFSWIASPRAYPLRLYETSENPTSARITFFRCMLLVEQAAGGPIYVGDDLINTHTPFDFPEEPFSLPSSLDSWWPEWREHAQLPLAPDELRLCF